MLEKHRPDPHKSLVGFYVGEVHYAVPIAEVKEIINPAPVTVLPHAPRAVAGVADHRGEVVPVVDLRARFGLPPVEAGGRVKWILVDVSGRAVGLVVDSVTEVFGTGGEGLRPPPSVGGGEETRGIAGVTSHDGALTFVLDVSRLESLTAGIDGDALLDAGGGSGR